MRTAPGVLLIATLGGACGDDVGTVQFLVPPRDLPNGMVFATAALPGANNYDLFWVALDGSQGPIQLTDTGANEWMPSASDVGLGLVFAREEDGIFYVRPDGEVVRISDVSGTDLEDSFPTLSPDGAFVAWVREDAQSLQTYVVMATTEGTQERDLDPTEGVIQLAPVFSPVPGSTELIWSEVRVGPEGPVDFNLNRFDHRTLQDEFICPSDGLVPADGELFRCFGFHATWPDDLVLTQQQLRLPLNGAAQPSTHTGAILDSLVNTTIVPVFDDANPGWFRPFPLSASISNNVQPGTSVMVFDGFVTFNDGRNPSLAFFRSLGQGEDALRIPIAGLSTDLDFENTADFLFSVATPTLLGN